MSFCPDIGLSNARNETEYHSKSRFLAENLGQPDKLENWAWVAVEIWPPKMLQFWPIRTRCSPMSLWLAVLVFPGKY